MSEGLTTSITFELPVGYEDESGTLHRSVTMRRLKNSDITAVQVDIELNQIASKSVDLYSGNPAQQFIAAAATAQVYAILYPLVVIKLGSLPTEKITRKVFENFYQVDANFLFVKYCELNNIALKAGEGRPFVPGASL
jgi:hypothetical protein